MLYLRDFKGTFGSMERPLTPREFQCHLVKVATSMFDNGWTVTGSWFKKSCVRPWGQTSREQLFDWTCEDLYLGKANAINLRLRDSFVIAIDCDVYDPNLSAEFFEKLVVLLGLSQEQLFTTVGGKGYKLFFRREPNTKFPPVLAEAYCGTTKQMVEIKYHLSTAAGVYNNDFSIYHPLEGTNFITQAKPQDLPELSPQYLPHIKRIFLELCADYGYVNAKGNPIVLPWLKHAVRQVLSKFYTEFKDRLNEVKTWNDLPAEWRAFCRLQGSKVYQEALQACFLNSQPEFPSATFLQCQDLLQEFKALIHQYPAQIEFYAGKFNNFNFSDYATFLKLLLLTSEHPVRINSDMEVYAKLLTARGVKF